MSALFVIAREDRLDDALAHRAAERGFEVLRLPLLASEPGSDGDRFLAWLAHPPERSALAWTSRRAADTIARVALPRHRVAIASLPLFAVGAESAAPMRDVGLAVTTPPESNANAKGLAALIARPAGAGPAGATIARVAFAHGDRALPDLPAALSAAGIEVEPFEIYRTSFLSPDVGGLERATVDGRVAAVAFFSPSGVDSLERLLRPETLALLRRDVPAIGRGDTTRAALAARGYRKAAGPRTSEGFDIFALEALQSSLRTIG